MMASPSLSKAEQCVSGIGGDAMENLDTAKSKRQVWYACNSHDALRRS